ncbi:MAG: Sec-independent protein translocase protein TatB [Xanthobacteraceae bacterium]
MFDIGWSELLLIGIVALVVIGPKELPGALRTLGQFTGKLRRMASEFQSQFHEAMREAEMADLKKEVDELTSKAQSYANFDPVSDIRKELESTQHHIEDSLADKPAQPPQPAAAADPALPAAAVPAAIEPSSQSGGDQPSASAGLEPVKPSAGGPAA